MAFENRQGGGFPEGEEPEGRTVAGTFKQGEGPTAEESPQETEAGALHTEEHKWKPLGESDEGESSPTESLGAGDPEAGMAQAKINAGGDTPAGTIVEGIVGGSIGEGSLEGHEAEDHSIKGRKPKTIPPKGY